VIAQGHAADTPLREPHYRCVDPLAAAELIVAGQR